jgi:LCP family protein required for cell wall assembly
MLRVRFTNSNPGWKRKRILYTILAWVWVIVLVLGIVFVGVVIFIGHGQKSLKKNAGEGVPELIVEETIPETEEKAVEWQEGWVRYGDKVYEYNDDILTFLVMGIDKSGKVEPAKTLTDGGQSDANFLVIANPDTKELSVLGVNRDTMVEVTMIGLGDNGEDVKITAELAVQHGFGDGMEQSCELTKAVVSDLFYGLPIHGYLSFNIGGIGALNDALGGVDVTIPEDMTKMYPDWVEGTQVHLKGKRAEDFIRWRDETIFESARMRLSRQKQYLTEFAKKAMEGTKEDIRLPLNLYQSFKPYIVTDISADEISYLGTELIKYHFASDAIYTLEGETKMGEQLEEFYPDKDALRELMVKLFYREVVLDN